MLVLYHTDMAVCAAKVRIALAEKKLQWSGRHIDLAAGEQFSPEYLALNPNGVVPTLVHDGLVVRDSTVISEYLDEVFQDIPLRPSQPRERASMRYWTKQEDDIHQVVNTFMTAIGFRPIELQKNEIDRQRRLEAITDPIRRERWQSLVRDGLESPFANVAFFRLARLLKEMNLALQSGPWLAGNSFSLADIGYIPYFNALSMLQLSSAWRERFPVITDWYERARARPSFAAAILDLQPETRVAGLVAAGRTQREATAKRFDEIFSQV